jgi:hypothetical protein
MLANISVVAIIGLIAAVVDAHILMSNPIPYGKGTLNNSPLAADGSDFPCKQRPGGYVIPEKENKYSIGESVALSLVGSATHGGGSCQISLTTDLEPTKESKWMVIKSFEGGCPVNTEGNLSGGPTMVIPTSLSFGIPEGIEPGKYTLAWTWFNRIGNRKMYMNCAPITIAGKDVNRNTPARPQKDTKVAEKKATSFPPMFVANIGSNCTTPEGFDIRFPQAGNFVERKGDSSNILPNNIPVCSASATSDIDDGSPSSAQPYESISDARVTPAADSSSNTCSS